MTLPALLPGDPETDTRNVSITVPDWVYWRLVSVKETEQEEMSHLFYVACRAIISDFDAVEAIALKTLVERYAKEGYSDPYIGKILSIPPRRVRAVRKAFGIQSMVKGRKKLPSI